MSTGREINKEPLRYHITMVWKTQERYRRRRDG